jgi:Lrp/AsnC family transcriptional regulator, leucine-responsive regulatory protein
MNRSLYLSRRLDQIDRAIIAALYEDGRRTIKEVAELLNMSSPSITARIEKLKDAGAITGYTVVVDPGAFGLNVAAYVRMNAMPGQAPKLEKLNPTKSLTKIAFSQKSWSATSASLKS